MASTRLIRRGHGIKTKPERYRLRTKFDGEPRWTPTAWATSNRKVAQSLADEYRDDPRQQVWDYEAQRALEPRLVDTAPTEDA